jgi:hypothetical protein
MWEDLPRTVLNRRPCDLPANDGPSSDRSFIPVYRGIKNIGYILCFPGSARALDGSPYCLIERLYIFTGDRYGDLPARIQRALSDVHYSNGTRPKFRFENEKKKLPKIPSGFSMTATFPKPWWRLTLDQEFWEHMASPPEEAGHQVIFFAIFP